MVLNPPNRRVAKPRRTPLGAALPFGFVLGVLAACSTDAGVSSAPVTANPKSSPPAAAKPAPGRALAAIPDAPKRRRGSLSDSPISSLTELAGRTANEVAALLGKPEFRRKDGIAEVWRYDGEICFLDVFFYADKGVARVKHAEVRRPEGSPLTEKECIGDAVTG